MTESSGKRGQVGKNGGEIGKGEERKSGTLSDPRLRTGGGAKTWLQAEPLNFRPYVEIRLGVGEPSVDTGVHFLGYIV